MFVNVGTFRFRPMSEEDRKEMLRRMELDIPDIARASSGFRGVYFLEPAENELLAVWLWDSESDWDAAFPKFGPGLQEYVIPNLAGPPDRRHGDAVIEITP